MDALSHILEDIHFSHAEYIYMNGHGDWLVHSPEQSAMLIYVITAGQAAIYFRHETLLLDTGTILLIPHGSEHHLGHPDPNHSLSTPQRPPHQSISFVKNDNMLLHIGTGHSQAVVLAARCMVNMELSRPLLAALPDSFLLHSEDHATPPWLQLGLQFLGLEAIRDRPGRDILLNRLASMLFVECVRDYVEQLPQDSESWLIALRDPTLTPALSAIHDRPDHPWTVAELASITHMSRSSFAERFTEIIGQPPLSYLSAHRLRVAAYYLTQSYESIARISERVGYSSEAAFSQAFKRQYEKSPSQFRKDIKDQQTRAKPAILHAAEGETVTPSFAK